MAEKNDFTWGKDRVNKNGNLGKIVAIPPEVSTDEAEADGHSTMHDVDFEVDEFKEKMAEKLSKELHKE
ncbi:hypothetical protein V7O62_10115 [Methanolobus sp. ZRKC2]|uniref:hypothetical protein n=1 Tax=Methanolobus sp. ZRKC2 TaxID=3125783 RepID=UPI003256429B